MIIVIKMPTVIMFVKKSTNLVGHKIFVLLGSILKEHVCFYYYCFDSIDR